MHKQEEPVDLDDDEEEPPVDPGNYRHCKRIEQIACNRLAIVFLNYFDLNHGKNHRIALVWKFVAQISMINFDFLASACLDNLVIKITGL